MKCSKCGEREATHHLTYVRAPGAATPTPKELENTPQLCAVCLPAAYRAALVEWLGPEAADLKLDFLAG